MSDAKTYNEKNLGLNLYRMLYLNDFYKFLERGATEIEPIQNVVFKFSSAMFERSSPKLNLYRMLYLNPMCIYAIKNIGVN